MRRAGYCMSFCFRSFGKILFLTGSFKIYVKPSFVSTLILFPSVIMILLTSVSNYLASDAMLSSQQLKRLSEHKYSAQNNSFLDNLFMQNFWNWLVLHYPVWVAPNLITITGLLCNIGGVLILSYFNPDGKQTAPFWTYLICAITLFVYQTLDATDGKQARRTNSSSPLGELFDHGCDSLSQVFVALEVALSLVMGFYPNILIFACVLAEVLFYVAHWQTYVSGTLTFGKFDVTEAQFCVIILCFMSAILGPAIWTTEILGLEIKLIIVFICSGQAFLNLFRYFQIIFTGGVGKNGSTVAGTSILYPLLPMLTIILPQIIIYNRSKTTVFVDHIVLYCITFGLISSKITNKLVVAHMTKSPLNLWDPIFYGPIALGFNQYLDTLVPEYLMLIICLVYCSLNLFFYCKEVCRSICSYLRIEVFRIPYEKNQQNSTANNKTAPNVQRKQPVH